MRDLSFLKNCSPEEFKSFLLEYEIKILNWLNNDKHGEFVRDFLYIVFADYEPKNESLTDYIDKKLKLIYIDRQMCAGTKDKSRYKSKQETYKNIITELMRIVYEESSRNKK